MLQSPRQLRHLRYLSEGPNWIKELNYLCFFFDKLIKRTIDQKNGGMYLNRIYSLPQSSVETDIFDIAAKEPMQLIYNFLVKIKYEYDTKRNMAKVVQMNVDKTIYTYVHATRKPRQSFHKNLSMKEQRC